MPRSATKVKKSLHEKLAEWNQRAHDMENQITSFSKKGDAASAKKVNELRVPLCEVFGDLLLTDANFSRQHDVTGRLWRQCFYSRIGPQRTKIAKATKRQKQTNAQLEQAAAGGSNAAATGMSLKQQQEQCKQQAQVLAQMEKNLMFFLSEGITMYDYLIKKLQEKLPGVAEARALRKNNSNGSLSTASYSTGETSSMGSSAVVLQKHRQQQQQQQPDTQGAPAFSVVSTGVVECLHHLYIHLGDLYRYSSGAKKAEMYYLTAAKLGPAMGHAYNQTAVLCQVKDSEGTAPLAAVAFYWYTRSLLASREPFKTAKVNLTRLLQGNRDWLVKQKKQQHPSAAESGILPSKSVQSRRFLAQFVDLHYQYFQGVQANAESIDAAAAYCAETMDVFAGLLKNSALGDALLCKLVTISAFSEFHTPEDNNEGNETDSENRHQQLVATTWLCARRATLLLGTHLANRLLSGPLPKWLQQQQEDKTKTKTNAAAKTNTTAQMPSVRLLLPLLLITEYLKNQPMKASLAEKFGDKSDSLTLIEQHDKAWKGFWKCCVDVWNLLHRLTEATAGEGDSMEQQKALLSCSFREYENLRGYTPFAALCNRGANQVLLSTGFVSDVEGVRVLGLESTAVQDVSARVPLSQQESVALHSTTSNMSSSSSQQSTGANDHNQGRIKVARFLDLGRKLANTNSDDNDDNGNSDNNRLQKYIFFKKDGKTLEWIESEDDIIMSDQGSSDDPIPMDEDVVATVEETKEFSVSADADQQENKNKSETLTYRQVGAGPPLLVPGALLQGLANVDKNTGTPSLGALGPSAQDRQGPTNPENNLEAPGTARNLQTLNASLATDTISAKDDDPYMSKSATSADKPMVQAPPPPGFGPPPGFAARRDDNNIEHSDAGHASVLAGAQQQNPTVVATDLFPNFQQQTRQSSSQQFLPSNYPLKAPVPTIGDSLDMFAGNSSTMQTSNPFAFTSSVVGVSAGSTPSPALFGENMTKSRLFGVYSQTVREDTSFLGGVNDNAGSDGATLLGSGLLDSLMGDGNNNNGSSIRKTNNPFAT